MTAESGLKDVTDPPTQGILLEPWQDDFADEIVRREISIQAQKEAGRTGGGPECQMCGERALRSVPNSRNLYQCGSCSVVHVVRVTTDGLLVEPMED